MTSLPIAVTARLSPELKSDADAYAERVGVSFNGLLSIALRDYLDGRRSTSSASPVPKALGRPPTRLKAAEADAVRRQALAAQDGPFKAPKGPRERCPCGSRQQWRHCHGRSSL